MRRALIFALGTALCVSPLVISAALAQPKAAAYKAILDRQIADKRSTARGSQVSDLF